MKNIILILSIVLFSLPLMSQENVEALVKEGIQFHDQGKYDEAIQSYKKALKIDPNSPLVHYELAMTYMYSKDYQKSIDHSDQVIKLDKDYRLMAYITKGSCLDNTLPAIRIIVPRSLSCSLVINSTCETAAMEAMASPRKPIVLIAKRSSEERILEVACLSKHIRASIGDMPLPSSMT